MLVRLRLLLFCLLLIGPDCFAAPLKAKKVSSIEIFYVNPNTTFFTAQKKEDIMAMATDTNGLHPDTAIKFYRSVSDPELIQKILSSFEKTSRCYRAQESPDVRVVIKINVADRSDYIFLEGVITQNIYYKNWVYNPNKNFYSYIMSLWKVDFEFYKALRDGSCREVLFQE